MGADRGPAWGAIMKVRDWGDDRLIHFGATPGSVARSTSGLVYLATPYSKIAVDRAGRWSLVESMCASERAAKAAARLTALGITAVSPIVQAAAMCHASHALDPLDAVFWTRWCAPLLDACQAVVIPDIAGWDRSEGVWIEAREAVAQNKPVFVYGAAV